MLAGAEAASAAGAEASAAGAEAISEAAGAGAGAAVSAGAGAGAGSCLEQAVRAAAASRAASRVDLFIGVLKDVWNELPVMGWSTANRPPVPRRLPSRGMTRETSSA